MQELNEGLQKHISANTTPDSQVAKVLYPELEELAKKWACAALNTYQGELLRKALEISAAITDFNGHVA